jgi:enoyl-CoA hydratase/carnithine racemase
VPAHAEFSRDAAVATIAFVPDAPVTSLSRDFVRSFNAALDELEQAEGVHCAVVAGTGKTFIVGADVKEIESHDVAQNLAYNHTLIDLNQRIDALEVPVVACLNGHAFGGGLELALACSVRVAAEDALVGLPEVKLGILPGAGGVVRLTRAVGAGAALAMMLTGRSVPAPEALRIGLVDELAPAGGALDHAQALAREIAGRAPLAVRAIKAAVREVEGMDTGAAVQAVHARLGRLLESDDATEGVAAFIQKRAPRFAAT